MKPLFLSSFCFGLTNYWSFGQVPVGIILELPITDFKSISVFFFFWFCTVLLFTFKWYSQLYFDFFECLVLQILLIYPFPHFCDSFGGDIGVIFFSTNIPVNNFLLLVCDSTWVSNSTYQFGSFPPFISFPAVWSRMNSTDCTFNFSANFFIWGSSKSFPCWPQFLVSKDLWLLHPLLTVSDISIPQELVNTIFFHSLLCRLETIGPALNGALEPPTTQEPDSPLAYLCPAF